jgi:hypothetical protein
MCSSPCADRGKTTARTLHTRGSTMRRNHRSGFVTGPSPVFGGPPCVCVSCGLRGTRAHPRSTPNRSMQSSSAISLVSDRIVRETSCKPWRSRASSSYMQTVATSDAMWHYSFFFGIHQWRNQYSKLGWAINFFPAHQR